MKRVFKTWQLVLILGAFLGSGYQQKPSYEVVVLTKEQINEFVERHNFYRSEVGCPPLKWNKKLASYAQEWAIELAKRNCKMQHRPHKGSFAQRYGENLFWASYAPTPTRAVESWAEEKPDYDGGRFTQSNFKAGHYTQMIWKNTENLGCAIVRCKNSSIVVCNYDPAGNIIGRHPTK